MALIEHNKRIERALAFITEERIIRPEVPIFDLVDEASIQFDLTPLDTIHLNNLFAKQANEPILKSNNTVVTDNS